MFSSNSLQDNLSGNISENLDIFELTLDFVENESNSISTSHIAAEDKVSDSEDEVSDKQQREKRIRFNPKPTYHILRTWAFAHRQARKVNKDIIKKNFRLKRLNPICLLEEELKEIPQTFEEEDRSGERFNPTKTYAVHKVWDFALREANRLTGRYLSNPPKREIYSVLFHPFPSSPSPQRSGVKKCVRFNLEPTIHVLPHCPYEWEARLFDSRIFLLNLLGQLKFQNRIRSYSRSLKLILDPEHRYIIFEERFRKSGEVD